jgi:hypothetical protein
MQIKVSRINKRTQKKGGIEQRKRWQDNKQFLGAAWKNNFFVIGKFIFSCIIIIDD